MKENWEEYGKWRHGKQREEILNSLPTQARDLMTALSLYGNSLTPEGEALKKGLNYLKQLSN